MTFPTRTFTDYQGVIQAEWLNAVDDFCSTSAPSLSLEDYTALRAYTGVMDKVYITGLPGLGKPAGIAGMFQVDNTDTTSPDNGGTIIVGADGRRWKRYYDGAVNVQWFGAVGDGQSNATLAIQAALDTKKSVFVPSGVYLCGKLYLHGTGQEFFGDGHGATTLQYTGTSGVFINGEITNPISHEGHWNSDYGDTLYLADGAKVRDMQIKGLWSPNSTNTSIGIGGQFGGCNYGGVERVDVRNFNIGVQMAGSIQFCRGVWFTSCLFGWKTSKTSTPFTDSFNDTIIVDGCWASWCGQGITQTPTAQSLSGKILTLTVTDASKFMQWTAITQAATAAGAVIQSINTGTNQITCYVYKGVFDISPIVNAQGACYWLSEATQNCRFTHNEISESAQGIVTMFGGAPSYVDQFWVDIGMWGPALIETNSGSIIQGPIGFTGVNTNDFVADTSMYYGYTSLGLKTALYGDGTVPGYGMALPNGSPVRSIYDAGWRAQITDQVLQVFGAGADATDSGAAAVQYSWVANKSAGNAPVVLSIGYHNAIATGGYLTTGARTPLPLSGKLIDLIASGATSTMQPSVDALASLGTAPNRWNVVFAATGAINTSDGREKQQIKSLSSAEKAVALRLKSLIKTFKFNDAVRDKGSAARIHCGIIAQDVKSAFEAEGLVAEDYAILCHDVWEESQESVNENGEVISPYRAAGDRYGVRYDELMAFVIASM